MENPTLEKYDNLGLIEKRISYLLGSKLRNKDRIKQAIEKKDKIKKRHRAIKDWDSVSQIRKWRQTK